MSQALDAILNSSWVGWPLLIFGLIFVFVAFARSRITANRGSIAIGGDNNGANVTGQISGDVNIQHSSDSPKSSATGKSGTPGWDRLNKVTLFLGASAGFVGAITELLKVILK